MGVGVADVVKAPALLVWVALAWVGTLSAAPMYDPNRIMIAEPRLYKKNKKTKKQTNYRSFH